VTLQQLSEQIEEEVARRGIPSPGGRVSAVPNARTIRYYTTLGLVDKPLSYDAGIARYGERHLLQLLAVKTLQAEYLPLPEIQKRLLGRSDAELRKIVSHGVPRKAPARPATWLAHAVAPGLTLVVQDEKTFREWAAHPEALSELRRRLDRAAGELL
jgi:DNA-binding transcriptional MerR regulator